MSTKGKKYFRNFAYRNHIYLIGNLVNHNDKYNVYNRLFIIASVYWVILFQARCSIHWQFRDCDVAPFMLNTVVLGAPNPSDSLEIVILEHWLRATQLTTSELYNR